MGRIKRAYRKYINKAIPSDIVPDSDIVFITYADIPTDTLKWIEKQVRKTADFEHVVFQQASAAISSNCGPGTFGILYFVKSDKSYNIASFINDMHTIYETDVEEEMSDDIVMTENEGVSEEKSPDAGTAKEKYSYEYSGEDEWCRDIKCIDVAAAIRNSGSAEAFKAVLQIFYDSIPDKHEELERCYYENDWKNYTIKIHALKSSARLIGAAELGDRAEKLEMAGKEDNIGYIVEILKQYIALLAVSVPQSLISQILLDRRLVVILLSLIAHSLIFFR